MPADLSIEWINHASFVLRQNGLALACDPWLEGTAFKDGWELVAPPKFTYGDFAGIDYLWFSHQHPDHFAPTNLRKIAPEVRRKLTVLYQTTADRLVVNWCRSAGFGKVIELPLGEWYRIADGLSVMCGVVNDDSWLAMKTPTTTLLNVNDCVLKRMDIVAPIAEAVGPIDVLFTQFSYAQWTGNPPESERRRQDALEKYERIALQDRVLRPKTIVPFASYIYFCHEENFFLNDGVNLAGDIARFIESDLKKNAVVLYPGDVWDPRTVPSWHENAARYARDLEAKLAAGPTHHRRETDPQQVVDAVNRFVARLRKKNPYARRLINERAVVYLTDAGGAYEISMDGMRRTSADERAADIATSGENILYALKTPWGGNTLHVSGRFVSWTNQHERFFAIMRKFHHYNVTPINLEWFAGIARRVARGVARRAKSLRRQTARKGAGITAR